VPSSKYTNVELIASYADRLLKSGGEALTEEQTEAEMDKVMALFTYVTEKDTFGEIYRNQLAKRLLGAKSAGNDAERLMISKLKSRCGAQYTSKLEGMLNDLTLARDHAADFKTWLTTRAGVGLPLTLDFSVHGGGGGAGERPWVRGGERTWARGR
jgi:cullin 1